MNKYTLFAALVPLGVHAQTISYTWPGPMGQHVVYAIASDPRFMGTSSEWHGVVPATGLDNSTDGLRMIGWPCEPGEDHLRINVLAFVPMVVDSITLVHRASPQGPQHLLLAISSASSSADQAFLEHPIEAFYSTTRINVHALLSPAQGAEYDHMGLTFIPFGGAGGTWDIRSLVIYGSVPKTGEQVPSLADLLKHSLTPDPRQK